MSERTSRGPLRRRPIAAWLVTGPVGRLAGFALDLLRELGRLASDRVATRTSRRVRGR